MYTRLTEEQKKQLRISYGKSQEYMITYSAISAVSDKFNDLSPEEIWDEALDLMEELCDDENLEWKADKLYYQLVRKYDVFVENGQQIRRDIKEREHTATLVLFDVMMMLVLKCKVEKDNIALHPYYPYMMAIAKYFNKNILFDSMLAVAQQEEENIEKNTGKEISPQDYLDGRISRTIEQPICPYIHVDLMNSEGITKKMVDKAIREAASLSARRFIARLEEYENYLDFGDDDAKTIHLTLKKFYPLKDYGYNSFVDPFYVAFPERRPRSK